MSVVGGVGGVKTRWAVLTVVGMYTCLHDEGATIAYISGLLCFGSMKIKSAECLFRTCCYSCLRSCDGVDFFPLHIELSSSCSLWLLDLAV